MNNYKPSSETERKQVEALRNAQRLNKYRDKHLIDVSSDKEVLPDDYQKALDNDPAYQEWLDKFGSNPF